MQRETITAFVAVGGEKRHVTMRAEVRGDERHLSDRQRVRALRVLQFDPGTMLPDHWNGSDGRVLVTADEYPGHGACLIDEPADCGYCGKRS